MVKIALITLLYFISSASSEEKAKPKYKDFVRQIYVLGVGQIKMDYKTTGEPISRPREISFWVKCDKKKDWQPVGKYLMCELTNYEYLADAKKIAIKYIDGRVKQDTGESICDVAGEGEIDAKTLCK